MNLFKATRVVLTYILIFLAVASLSFRGLIPASVKADEITPSVTQETPVVDVAPVTRSVDETPAPSEEVKNTEDSDTSSSDTTDKPNQDVVIEEPISDGSKDVEIKTIEEPAVSTASTLCAQVITRACQVSDPSVCQEFSSSCIPDGWVKTELPVATTPTTTEPSTSTPAASTPTTPEPSASPSPTPSSAPTSTPDVVTAGQEYKASSNSKVSIKFNTLPVGSGTLNISEQSLSQSQIDSTKSLSDKFYEITSSMTNGTFTYDLTLPLPAGVNGQNFKVKYASSVSELGNAQEVSQNITLNGDGSFTIHNLDHFTVFVVTNPSTQANCDTVTVGTTPGSTCFTTVQAAVNAASNGDTINIGNTGSPYNETVYVNKQLTINGVGNPSVNGFILQVTPVTITGIAAGFVRIETPTVSMTTPVNSGNQTAVTISGTGSANAAVNYTITGTSGSVTGTGTVTAGGVINIPNVNVSSLPEGSLTLTVTLSSNGYSSNSATANAFKDTIAPAAPTIATFTSPIQSGNQTSVGFSGTGEAGSTLTWTITDGVNSVSGSLVVPASGSFTISNQNVSALADGNVTYRLTLTDTATNVSTTTTQVVQKDVVSPVTTDNTDSSWHTSPVTITLTCSDTSGSGCATTYYTTDGSIPTTASAQGTSIVLSTDGVYTIRYFSVDVFGNSEVVKTAANQVRVDQTNPTNPGTPTTTTPTNSTTQVWNWTTSTDLTSGVARYLLSIDGGAQINIGNVLTFTTNLSQGTHTFALQAQDIAGNLSGVVTGNVVVDTTNPVTTDSGIDTLWHNTPVTVTLNCTDNLSGCSQIVYTTDGLDPITSPTRVVVAGSSTSFTLSVQGVYTVKYYSIDLAGNQEATKISANTVKIDTTLPVLSSDNIIAGWFTTNPTITLSIADNGGSLLNNVRYSWDTPATATFGTIFVNGSTINVPSDGVHTLYLYADDNATNSQVFSAVYRFDSQNPTVVASGSSAAWTNVIPAIVINGNDPTPGSGIASIQYSWNGAPLQVVANGTDLSTLPTFPGQGNNTLSLIITDIAGRTSSFTGSYMIDQTNPTSAGSPLTTSPTNSTTQVWTWTAATDSISGVNSYLVSVDGGALINIGNVLTYTTNLTQGTHTLSVVTVDNAGNLSSAVTSTVVVDTTAPVTTDNTDNLWHNTPVTITLNCTDNLSGCAFVVYTTDGSNPVTSPTRTVVAGSSATFTLSAQGIYSIRYYSIDAAGNQEVTVTAVNQVMIDITAPQVNSIALTNNTTGNTGFVKNGDSVTLSANITDNNQTLITTSMITADLSALGGGVAVNPISYDTVTGIAIWAPITVTGTTNGVVTITVNVIDTAGNTGAGVYTTTADNIAPTLTSVNMFSSNANSSQAAIGDTVTLTFDSSETIQTPVVTIAGQTVVATNVGGNTWVAQYIMTNTDVEGLIPFTIDYMDLAGNIGATVSSPMTVTFDMTAPVAPVLTLPNFVNNANKANVTLTITGEVGTTYFYNITDGTNNLSGSAVMTTPTVTITGLDLSNFNEGGIVVQADLTDAAGNISSTGMAVSIKDTVAPVVSAGSNQTSTGSFTQTGTATDPAPGTGVANTTWSQSSGPGTITFGSANSLTTTVSANQSGAYVIALNASDVAGNTGSSSFTLNYTVPATASNSSSSSSNNSSNNSTGSGQSMVCTDAKPSKAPRLLSIKATGPNEMTLTWTRAGDPTTYYLITYGTASGVFQFGAPNIGNVTSYVVKGLTPGVTYFFKVQAVNNCMPGDFSNELSAKAFGSVLSTPVTTLINNALGVSGVNAKSNPLRDDVTFEDSEAGAVDSEATASSTVFSTPSASMLNTPTKRVDNTWKFLLGLGLVFIAAGATSYYFAIYKDKKTV